MIITELERHTCCWQALEDCAGWIEHYVFCLREMFVRKYSLQQTQLLIWVLWKNWTYNTIAIKYISRYNSHSAFMKWLAKYSYWLHDYMNLSSCSGNRWSLKVLYRRGDKVRKQIRWQTNTWSLKNQWHICRFIHKKNNLTWISVFCYGCFLLFLFISIVTKIHSKQDILLPFFSGGNTVFIFCIFSTANSCCL